MSCVLAWIVMLGDAPNGHGECIMVKESGGQRTKARARNARASLPELGRPRRDTAARVGGVLPHHSLKALRRSSSVVLRSVLRRHLLLNAKEFREAGFCRTPAVAASVYGASARARQTDRAGAFASASQT